MKMLEMELNMQPSRSLFKKKVFDDDVDVSKNQYSYDKAEVEQLVLENLKAECLAQDKVIST